MTELERRCLKQNATELRRIATKINSLEDAPTRSIAQNEVFCLQVRLEEVVSSMKSLQDVLEIPLKDYDGENLHKVKLINK
jgi:hypothetical protein